MMMSNEQQMHDNNSVSSLGKGNDNGDMLYVLGERSEADNPDKNYIGKMRNIHDKYDNFGKLLCIDKTDFITTDMKTSTLGKKMEVFIDSSNESILSQDSTTTQDLGNAVHEGQADNVSESDEHQPLETSAHNGLPSKMSMSPLQPTDAINNFYENLEAWENRTYFQTQFSQNANFNDKRKTYNFDDIKLDKQRILKTATETSKDNSNAGGNKDGSSDDRVLGISDDLVLCVSDDPIVCTSDEPVLCVSDEPLPAKT
jgi:hypothetical protein